jgi:hypothetical protein
MFWQCITFRYEPGFTWNHWTADYGVMYMFGPFLGSLMGGNLYNYIRRLEYRLPRMKVHEVEGKKKKRSNSDSESGTHSSGTSVRTSELSDMTKDSMYFENQLKNGIKNRMGKMKAVDRITD